jgi:hypothetical protein
VPDAFCSVCSAEPSKEKQRGKKVHGAPLTDLICRQFIRAEDSTTKIREVPRDLVRSTLHECIPNGSSAENLGTSFIAIAEIDVSTQVFNTLCVARLFGCALNALRSRIEILET